jgi:hypothetical protein
LKEGLNTGQWRVYKCKEEPSGGVCLVLSTNLRSAASLERMKWHPFNSMGQVTFSLGAKSEERRLEEGPIGDMVRTILFILTNLQHSIADSTILSRTAVVKGMDTALIQEPSYFEGHILWV